MLVFFTWIIHIKTMCTVQNHVNLDGVKLTFEITHTVFSLTHETESTESVQLGCIVFIKSALSVVFYKDNYLIKVSYLSVVGPHFLSFLSSIGVNFDNWQYVQRLTNISVSGQNIQQVRPRPVHIIKNQARQAKSHWTSRKQTR